MVDSNGLIIFLVGEPSSGKSWIRNDILSKYPAIKVITKYTTRKPRVDEDSNSETRAGVNYEVVSQMEYTYVNPHNNEFYGFNKEDIETALDDGYIPCISSSSEDVYKEIIDDFPDKKVLLFKMVPYLDEESLQEGFEKQGRSQEEFNERKRVLENPITDWAYYQENMREIINPFFLRNCPPKVAKGVVVRRIEEVLENECGASLGDSFRDDNSSISGIYNYVYNISLNRPHDKELNFENKNYNVK